MILPIIALIVALYFIYFRRKPKGFPPGPTGVPILGNLLQLGMEPYIGATKMRGKYGDIIGLDLGVRRSVFINEYKLLKEAFNLSAFNGRCKMDHFSDPEGIRRGIAYYDGKTWVEQRKFALSYMNSTLRNDKLLEKSLLFEVSELVQDLKKRCGTPIDTHNVFNISVVNTLWSIIGGKRYSLSDPEFNRIFEHVSAIHTSSATIGLLVFYPTITKLLPTLSGFKTFQDHIAVVTAVMKDTVDDHKKTYEDGVQRDYVDCYLNKVKSTTDPMSSFYGENGEKNLVYNLKDLFFGGTDTVSGTLRWLMFLMAHFPELQEKLITYIAENTVRGELSLEDRTRLPYIEAVIQEILRFSALLPMGFFHEILEDANLGGYTIPKGTVIVANQYGIMHDPEIWGDPENFRPERFLTEDESEVIRHPALVPFGAGRRICPGESLARDELFLFVTSLFQNFRVEFDPAAPKPPLKYVLGLQNHPVDHKIVLHYLS